MRCALVLFSYAALEAFSGYRFRERRDRPLCHLMVRQQTWQESQNTDRRRWTADVGIASAISKPGAFVPGVMCSPLGRYRVGG